MHSSTRIMLAALKFFLGQDEADPADSDDDDDDTVQLMQPSKAEIYKATKKVSVQFFRSHSCSHGGRAYE